MARSIFSCTCAAEVGFSTVCTLLCGIPSPVNATSVSADRLFLMEGTEGKCV